MRTSACLLALLITSCTLDPFEPVVVARDAGGGFDASAGDAGGVPRVDASVMDAAPMDAAQDAGFDAAFDADLPDTCAPVMESCNDLDDDCDGSTDEGVMQICRNACGMEGTETCVGGAFVGCDAPAEPSEVCNGLDDDCDGTIDEGAGCPCTLAHHAGHAYLFCTEARRWSRARDVCRDEGYTLVTIDDDAENTFVGTRALMERDDDWWIGLHDQRSEGTFEWESGAPVTFTGWAAGEPNNAGGNQDCAQIVNGIGGGEARGTWDDESCGQNDPYVCESP